MRKYIVLALVLSVMLVLSGCCGYPYIPSENSSQQGCQYNNPSCDGAQECINNVCQLKTGCDYNNPSCSSDSICVNNACIKKEGCQYDSPPCEADYACTNNACVKEPDYIVYTSLSMDTEPYLSAYCDKIDPYNPNVREAAAEAIGNDSGLYRADQLFDIYDWVKKNVIYQNVPLAGIPYPPSETLATGSGDCKNQAVLISSMVDAIGGTGEVVVDPACKHAYALIYFGPAGSNTTWFTKAVHQHYGPDVRVKYITLYNSTMWVIYDGAGAYYPGDTLPQCTGNRSVYLVTSCMSCAKLNPATPYNFHNKCYVTCPPGTLTSEGSYYCYCAKGSQFCNDQCVGCPSGSYLSIDCTCHQN